MTPPAQALFSSLNAILTAAKGRPKGSAYIDQALQDKLKGMTSKDMLALDPPSVDAGIWTNDAGFCRRLGAYLFGVSPESVDELPWQHLIFFQQIVTANFIKSLEAAVP
jgi:hypothetical protein